MKQTDKTTIVDFMSSLAQVVYGWWCNQSECVILTLSNNDHYYPMFQLCLVIMVIVGDDNDDGKKIDEAAIKNIQYNIFTNIYICIYICTLSY